MLKIDMLSSAIKIKGQGVGSAYIELTKMLEEKCQDSLDIQYNEWHVSQITHYHTIDLPFYFATFFKKRRGVQVAHVHFLPETLEGSIHLPGWMKFFFYRYIVAFYKRMDHLVVVNPSFISKLVALGIEETKVTYIPNFISQEDFHIVDSEKRQQLREKLDLAQNQFVILGVGQIQPRKGVHDFVRLAKQNPDIQFVWAGGFSFGKIMDGYQELKKIYDNPPQNLRFTGIIDREALAEYYQSVDLFLLPSYNELFPMSILEAFNCGTPVLLRDLPLYHAIIQDYYAPAKDIDEMQTQINDLQAHPEKLVELRERSKKAAAYYSTEHLAEIWSTYYQKIYQTKQQQTVTHIQNTRERNGEQ